MEIGATNLDGRNAETKLPKRMKMAAQARRRRIAEEEQQRKKEEEKKHSRKKHWIMGAPLFLKILNKGNFVDVSLFSPIS